MDKHSAWLCPQCGECTPSQIRLYREDISLQPQVRSLDPTCVDCGRALTFQPGSPPHSSTAQALIINGPCASGKTTISDLISRQHGYVQIDGDWLLRKHKLAGTPVQFDEIHNEIINLTQGMLFLGKSVVISHVILPEDLDTYEQTLAPWASDYRMVILMPDVETLLVRSQERTCWPKPTPEYWVRKFHEDFSQSPLDIQCLFHDNTHELTEQTVSAIMAE